MVAHHWLYGVIFDTFLEPWFFVHCWWSMAPCVKTVSQKWGHFYCLVSCLPWYWTIMTHDPVLAWCSSWWRDGSLSLDCCPSTWCIWDWWFIWWQQEKNADSMHYYSHMLRLLHWLLTTAALGTACLLWREGQECTKFEVAVLLAGLGTGVSRWWHFVWSGPKALVYSYHGAYIVQLVVGQCDVPGLSYLNLGKLELLCTWYSKLLS
jgi:hypothetical protein